MTNIAPERGERGITGVFAPVVSILPTGAIAETIPRAHQISFASPASGALHLNAILLSAGRTISTITHASVGTGMTAGTVQIFGLYSNTLSLLRATNDDGATAWNANATKTLTLTTPFTTTYDGLYYVAFLVAASTPPDVAADNGPVNSAVYTLTPALHPIAQTGITSLPALAVQSSANDRIFYAYVS